MHGSMRADQHLILSRFTFQKMVHLVMWTPHDDALPNSWGSS
jgi:hypothetical protein